MQTGFQALAPNIPVTISRGMEEDKVDDPLLELQNAARKTIFKTKTVFPFTFFPDTLIVDYQKISVVKRKFFFSEKVDSINHKDLLHVEVESGPLFSTLKISTKYYARDPLKMRYLKKDQAARARDILHGLISARQEDISISEVDNKTLVRELEEIGKVDMG